MGPELLFVGFAIFAIVVIVVSSAMQKRAAEARAVEAAAIAKAFGMEHSYGFVEASQGFWESLFDATPSNVQLFLAHFEGFQPFGQGHSHEVQHLIHGTEGPQEWLLFDYLYKTTHSNGKSTTTVPHPTGVLAVRIPAFMPRLDLGPEGFFSRIGTMLGAPEVDFESNEFNRRYLVRCTDKKFAYDVLHPRAIEFLLGVEPRSWQMMGQWLVLTKAKYFSYNEAVEARSHVQSFLALMPGYLMEDHGVAMMPPKLVN